MKSCEPRATRACYQPLTSNFKPSSRSQGDQIFQGLADFGFGPGSRPAVDFYVGAGDQDRDRLVGNPIGAEYLFVLVETPTDDPGRHQLGSPSGGRVKTGFPPNGDEFNLAGEISSHFVNDGQLPSTGASPLGPEHQIDGFLLIAERER